MKKKNYSRILSIFSLILAIATFLWFMPPSTMSLAQGGYGYGGSTGMFFGGVSVPSNPGFTSLSSRITTAGKITSSVTAKSADNLCKVTLSQGSTALDKSGNALSGIIIVVISGPPTPPAAGNIVSKTYNLTPDGATFSSPTLTITYDTTKIPAGVSEEDLVIAYYDEAGERWVNLASTVNAAANTVSAEVSHFTAFTVLAYSSPAAFTVDNLEISKTQLNAGESVIISVEVTNTGDLRGSYEVALKINNAVVEAKQVTLDSGASQTVSFATSRDAAGTYSVSINGQSGSFTVKGTSGAPTEPTPSAPAAFTTSSLSISPTAVNIGDMVTIAVQVANTGDLSGSYEVTLKINNEMVETKQVTLDGGRSQTVSFATSRDTAGTYSVNINSQSGSFTVTAAEVPSKPLAWWVWVIIGVVVVIAGSLVYFRWLKPAD
ncbi:MAG: CARDB domain-containing protein [Dehalococcoidales bacterium]|nr:CARDB domain-containing protein [Dehalococcoidales bacterium]